MRTLVQKVSGGHFLARGKVHGQLTAIRRIVGSCQLWVAVVYRTGQNANKSLCPARKKHICFEDVLFLTKSVLMDGINPTNAG